MGQSNRSYTNGAPSHYAAEKLALLAPRHAGRLSGLLRRMIPRAFPGGDPEALLYALEGFTAFSTGWRENTTEGVPTQSFHEVGLFQVPAGPRSGPAPNPDPRASNNAYGSLAGSDLVKQCLGGRAASLAPDAWRPAANMGPGETTGPNWRACEDQVAVGLANLRRDDRSVRTLLNNRVRGVAGDEARWTNWRVFLMFTAFSRGPGGADTRLAPYLGRLVHEPEEQRIVRLCELVEADIRTGASGIGARTGKSGTSYGIVRTLQKLYSGLWLLRQTGSSSAQWFNGVEIPAATEDLITRTAYGVSISGVAHDTVETLSHAADAVTSSSTGKVLVGALVVGGAVAVATHLVRA